MAKPFSWSYSKLKNFESCGFRHQQIDLLKAYQEEKGEHLTWGDDVHKKLASNIRDGMPLPKSMEPYQGWCDKFRPGPGVVILVEQKLAFRKDFTLCSYFDNDVWCRVVADATKIVGPVAATVDWKTGKILDDSVQLALVAQAIFSHHPQVQRIRTEFAWLKFGEASSRQDFKREDMAGVWRAFLPRVERLEAAYNSGVYHPTPSGLCRNYCPVAKCEYYKKGG
jgi:hypothetical protein